MVAFAGAALRVAPSTYWRSIYRGIFFVSFQASRPPVAQRDLPLGGHETPSIFQISPVRVTTYAVFPMNSSEVGRSRPLVMTVKVPSLLTLTSAPVFGSALLGSILGSTVPC